jgi:hypothetical protein
MGLSLNNIYQRPYVRQENRNPIKKREDEEKSAATTQREQESGQNSKSKGLQYVEQKAPTPTPAYKQKFAMPAANAYANVNVNSRPQVQQPQVAVQAAPQERPAVIDNKINIAQILKDFKNTSLAIGTPEDLSEIVDGYLAVVKKQVQKDNADAKLVKSTLKTAATVLDKHISETLGKDSKVVENWVETLFLQNIDLRYNENDINERFLVKFPEDSGAQTKRQEELKETAQVEQIPQQATEENSNKHDKNTGSV